MKPKRPYQDQWRGGKLVQKGRRECASRYEAIRDLAEARFGAGVSVADVGGWDGYFVKRLREDLEADAVNVDFRPAADLRMRVTAQNVHEIGQKDMILALSVLHHMDDWREVLEGLLDQCTYLVVEVCLPEEAKGMSHVARTTGRRYAEIFEAVKDGELICETPALDPPYHLRPMFLLIGNDLAPAGELEKKRAAATTTSKASLDVAVMKAGVGDSAGSRRAPTTHKNILGVVEKGSGKAARLMSDTEPPEWEALGYMPYPGTLNVKVPAKDRRWLEAREGVEAPDLGRSPHYVPVVVSGVECHVHFANNPPGRTVIELVAPVCLVETLGLSEGDTIEIEP